MRMGTNSNREPVFRFREFSVVNNMAGMKVGTDGVLLGAWADGDGCAKALDVGTGCGLIALMLAQRYKALKVLGIDIMDNAVCEAAENFKSSPWNDRLSARCIDFNSLDYSFGKFDMVVSNPPFFTTTLHSPDSARKAARHGVNLAFSDIIRRCAGTLLAEDGRLCMISPSDAGGDIEFNVALNGMCVQRRTDVFTRQGAPARRIMWQIGKKACAMKHDSLLIGSDEYKLLTSPFYL